MRISRYNGYNPNFGYDKQLNKELVFKLSQYKDKDWAKTILFLSSYCNFVEDNLNKKIFLPKSKFFKDYADILCSVKDILTGYVAMTFPELNFPDREYKHYDDEFKKHGSKDNDWRKGILNIIAPWTDNYEKVVETNNRLSSPQINESKSKTPENKNNTVNNEISSFTNLINAFSSKPSKKTLLEEYQPAVGSPKNFADVAGMDKLKRNLTEGIVLQMNNPEQAKEDFEDYGKTIPKALLLYGPPGCGKTYITQALAGEINAPMYLLNISKAGSYYINETSNNIKAAFDEAIEISKRENKPCLLFMDEIDSLGFNRTSHTWPEDIKQVATMLQSIDNVKNANVIIIGATNKYEILDPAIRRRFDEKILVDIPDKEAVAALLKMNLSHFKKGEKLKNDDKAIEAIVNDLYGFSNSSICNISKQAALNAMRRNRAEISVEDYQKAIKETTEEKPDRKLYLPDSANNSKSKIGFTV